jgi:hypothetical protein
MRRNLASLICRTARDQLGQPVGVKNMVRLSIDDRRSFSDHAEPLPVALAEPVERGAPAAPALELKPEHNRHYVIRFPSSKDPEAAADYAEYLYFVGGGGTPYWAYAFSDGSVDYQTVADAEFEVFAKSPRGFGAGQSAERSAPALEHNTYCVLRFADPDKPEDAADYLEALHYGGYWIFDEPGMGPIAVAKADYEVFARSPRVSSHAP